MKYTTYSVCCALMVGCGLFLHVAWRYRKPRNELAVIATVSYFAGLNAVLTSDALKVGGILVCTPTCWTSASGRVIGDSGSTTGMFFTAK